MAFTGTSLLSLPIITTGTESGAWGNITNNGLTQYLDTSIAGALSITSSITLANTSGDALGTNLASTTAQYRTLVVPASGPSANIVITAPSSNRTYHVVNRNATYTVQIRAGANSGVTLGVNQSATVTYNSTSNDYELVGVVGSTTGTATATKFIPTGNVTAGNGMYLPAANTLAWSNNGSETMRIDSSGNLLVGTTSTQDNARLRVFGSSTSGTNYTLLIEGSGGADNFYVRDDGEMYSLPTYNRTSAGASNVGIDSAGGFFRSTSSLKYKTDVQDAKHGLAQVMQLRPVTYKGKNDGETVFGGLIAEEVHESGLTEFVQYAKDGTPDALAYGNMVSLCIKAIQEQQALINELRARVAALESQP
jgi:hypothetical protein